MARWRDLAAARAETYRLATHRIDAALGAPDRGPRHHRRPAAAEARARPPGGDRMSTTVIPVTTPTGGYDAHVGRGLLEQIPPWCPSAPGAW